MMNKAEKRKLEVQAYSDAYSCVENYRDYQLREVKYWEDAKKEVLEENPEADTEWHDKNIEEHELLTNAYTKAMEAIFKLM